LSRLNRRVFKAWNTCGTSATRERCSIICGSGSIHCGLPEHELSTPEGKVHARHQHRVRRFSESEEGRIVCHFLRILAQSRYWSYWRLKTVAAFSRG
jgi:hypothetical protein